MKTLPILLISFIALLPSLGTAAPSKSLESDICSIAEQSLYDIIPYLPEMERLQETLDWAKERVRAETRVNPLTDPLFFEMLAALRCLSDFNDRLLKQFDQLPSNLDEPFTRAMNALLETHWWMLKRLGQKIELGIKQSPIRLLDARTLEMIPGSSLGWTFHNLIEMTADLPFHSVTPELRDRFFSTLDAHIVPNWTLKDYLLKGPPLLRPSLNAILKLRDPELRRRYTKLLYSSIFKNLIVFSPERRKMLTFEIDMKIREHYFNHPRFSLDSSDQSPTALGYDLKQLELLMHSLRRLSHLRPSGIFVYTAAVLGIDDKALIQSLVREYSREFPYKQYRLRPGDIYLTVDFDGMGQKFSSILQVDSVVTHGGVLHRGFVDGFPYYGIFEYSMDGVGLSNPTTQLGQDDTIVVRPRFEFDPEILGRAYQTLFEYQRRFFDLAADDSMINANGDISLYCTELVHYAFTNQFDLAAPVTGPSPFDGMDIQSYINPRSMLARNIQRLGHRLDRKLYLPHYLLLSPSVNILGAQYTSGLPRVTENFHLTHIQYLFEKELKYNLENRPLVSLNDGDRLYSEIASWVLNSYDHPVRHLADLPKGAEAKALFLRIAQLNQEYTKKFEKFQKQHPEIWDDLPHHQQQLLLAQAIEWYMKNIRPMFRNVFQGGSS